MPSGRTAGRAPYSPGGGVGGVVSCSALPGGVEVMLYEPRHATAIGAAK